jgi:hypothetical protein
MTAEYSDGESDAGMKRFNAINQYIRTAKSEKCLTHRARWRGAFVNNLFALIFAYSFLQNKHKGYRQEG